MPEPSEYSQCPDCHRLVGDANNEHHDSEDFCFAASRPNDESLRLDCYERAVPRMREALMRYEMEEPRYRRRLRDKAAAHALSWLGADKAMQEANKLMNLLGYQIDGHLPEVPNG